MYTVSSYQKISQCQSYNVIHPMIPNIYQYFNIKNTSKSLMCYIVFNSTKYFHPQALLEAMLCKLPTPSPFWVIWGIVFGGGIGPSKDGLYVT